MNYWNENEAELDRIASRVRRVGLESYLQGITVEEAGIKTGLSEKQIRFALRDKLYSDVFYLDETHWYIKANQKEIDFARKVLLQDE